MRTEKGPEELDLLLASSNPLGPIIVRSRTPAIHVLWWLPPGAPSLAHNL